MPDAPQHSTASATTGPAPFDLASFLRALGPGLLFAAAAVGVSHLVQSTRAGARFGLAMLLFVLAANAMKYPAFRLGPHYAAVTGTSLLEGYRRQGRWALVLYGVLTVTTMFVVQAAVTVVTAGLAIATLGLTVGPAVVASVLLVVCSVLLAIGQFRLLDRSIKVLVAVLTLATLVSTAMALGHVAWGTERLFPTTAALSDRGTILFIVALVGWMPGPLDISVWQSIWTLARGDDTQHVATLPEATLDFHIGYATTTVLAVCFLLMGAGIMHGSGATFPGGAGAFAAQVIRLYTTTMGAWMTPVIGVAAFAVMFSTTLTVLDGFPRALTVLVARFRGPEEPREHSSTEGAAQQRYLYLGFTALTATGAAVVLFAFLSSFKTLVDFATTMSFLTSPALAYLNHRAAHGAEVPADQRPASWLSVASWIGVGLQAAFAVYYLIVRYGF